MNTQDILGKLEKMTPEKLAKVWVLLGDYFKQDRVKALGDTVHFGLSESDEFVDKYEEVERLQQKIWSELMAEAGLPDGDFYRPSEEQYKGIESMDASWLAVIWLKAQQKVIAAFGGQPEEAKQWSYNDIDASISDYEPEVNQWLSDRISEIEREAE